jgi:hypothetical protein
VISTRDVEDADERETTTAVMTSVPVSVVNVKESVLVADVPGPMMMEDGSVEVEVSRVVVAAEAWEADNDDNAQMMKKEKTNLCIEI